MPTLKELRTRAKEKGLKGYSRLKKVELEELLSRNKWRSPAKFHCQGGKCMRISTKSPSPAKKGGRSRKEETLRELREVAKEMGFFGYSRLNKTQLKDLISGGSPKPRSPTKRERSHLREVFKNKSNRSSGEKMRMAKDCPSCCGSVDSGKCSYPMCAVGTCEKDCDSIYKSAVSARINKNRSKVHSPSVMENIIRKMDEQVKSNGCSRAKKSKK